MGISQYELAVRLGVAQSAVGGWESGKREPGLDSLQEIANLFDVTVDYLLGRDTTNSRQENLKKIVSERIRKERENKGLSQLELAEFLGISNTTLSQYENAQRMPSDDVKIKLAEIFDCTVDYLLGRTNVKRPYFAVRDDFTNEFLKVINERPEIRLLLRTMKNAPARDVKLAIKILEAFTEGDN